MPVPEVGPCIVRIPAALAEEMRRDLRRPHPFALERIGFLSVTTGVGTDGELLVLGADYQALPDEQYVESEDVGARINGDAIRMAMESVLATDRGLFHVHLHDHPGAPSFSWTDRSEQPRLIPSFVAVGPGRPHGMLVLSADAATAWVWLPRPTGPVRPRRTVLVGYPLRVVDPAVERYQAPAEAADWYDRQSFLGADSSAQLDTVRVGLIGYGGGGSHIGMQLAHLGIHRQRIFDADHITSTNHNRLVGGRADDIRLKLAKVAIAYRVITDIYPNAKVELYDAQWQHHIAALKSCDIIIGCVDTFAGRHELEVLARRYLIPYVDIGMDVRQVGAEPPRMAGQVILSLPGRPCMTCMGFLTPERLAAEAARYGDTGGRPQVVWPNGVLASTAVGIVVDLITGWSREDDPTLYYSYDGNRGTLVPHVRLQFLESPSCAHYPHGEAGDPSFADI
jgi:hypothetical protein